ncbi:hypothetical protein [Paraburkholderia madseniana]|nr:hypothetical protein [Paraburkholderia madseniana]
MVKRKRVVDPPEIVLRACLGSDIAGQLNGLPLVDNLSDELPCRLRYCFG